tara:strand:- start:712 stop:879 length:168 start_codon:yes stop_codon:yes gene_type:complete
MPKARATAAPGDLFGLRLNPTHTVIVIETRKGFNRLILQVEQPSNQREVKEVLDG